jgi:hypothetical protein
LSNDDEIRIGGVSKKNHRESEFRKEAQPLAVYVDVQHAQCVGAEDKAGRCEYDRATD